MSSLGDADAILRGRTRTGKSKKNEKEADPSTSYICHICATDVPAAFSGAHNASKTHRANASIMAAASERMRAMVTARPPPRTPAPSGHTAPFVTLWLTATIRKQGRIDKHGEENDSNIAKANNENPVKTDQQTKT
ncbi:uncharacterized protein [Choristoneura fumiferana]|uniref:uncharacterized protein n=1 Tax=Choristoneura fumiferana TaxID=7141 RepID=UPI003D158FBB